MPDDWKDNAMADMTERGQELSGKSLAILLESFKDNLTIDTLSKVELNQISNQLIEQTNQRNGGDDEN